ncbi:MAG: nuclear transport factor 2 family protein [Acidobacteria bacterium]|nr:nuclear transport factor 2 family protein [Acidobacteriota bacterium]MBI3261835.1 nuclear transport factor 2 family protein [Acidobacteriota bacterium]
MLKSYLFGITLALSLLMSPALSGQPPQSKPDPAADRSAVQQTVEEFLRVLGQRDIEKLPRFFADKAILVIVRQRAGAFTPTYQTAEEWLAGLRRATNAQTFEEPLSNISVTVESGHLAHLRAAFRVVRDGKTQSMGVDYFTLVKEGEDEWKIAMAAYTSLPASGT